MLRFAIPSLFLACNVAIAADLQTVIRSPQAEIEYQQSLMNSPIQFGASADPAWQSRLAELQLRTAQEISAAAPVHYAPIPEAAMPTIEHFPHDAGENRHRNPLDQGNDNCPAAVIPYLPFMEYWSTAGYANNFTCAGNTAPDAIYQLTPAQSEVYRIALCGSQYDTRLEIRTGGGCPGSNLVICNDDACGLQSEVFAFMTAGVTYYIIVDGYTVQSGVYRLEIDFTCVDGMAADLTECAESTDTTHAIFDCNGGPCNASWGGTPQYQTISCGQSIRGRAFTTISPNGGDVRDTDWYRFTVTEACSVRFTMTGEFMVAMQAGAFPPTCEFYPNYNYAPACTPLVLTMLCPTPGDYFVFAAVHALSGMNFFADYHLLVECIPLCPVDFTINAPGVMLANTCGGVNHCSLRPSEERTLRVIIPDEDDWQFSLCSGGSEWDSYLYLSENCCDLGTLIAQNDNGCPGTLRAKIDCVHLTAGAYFLTVEGATPADCGSFFAQVTRCVTTVCPPPDSLVIQPAAFPDFVRLSFHIPAAGLVRVYGSTSSTSDYPAGFAQVGAYNLAPAGSYTVTIVQLGDYSRYVVTLDNCGQ